VVRSESVRNIIRERRMLEHLNHPFLCNLRYSFQDAEYMYVYGPNNFLRNSSSSIFRYLVVDLMNGGDLRFHISRKAFTDEAVRFWMAELGCALRYIHSQGIVHRDVKPDNILLDSEGHVHLADFVSYLYPPQATILNGFARMLHPISGQANNLRAGLELSPT
jgi:serine/threonine kinase 32